MLSKEESRLATPPAVRPLRLDAERRRRRAPPIGPRPSTCRVRHGTRGRPFGTGGLSDLRGCAHARERSRGPTLPRPIATCARARQPRNASPPAPPGDCLTSRATFDFSRCRRLQSKTATAPKPACKRWLSCPVSAFNRSVPKAPQSDAHGRVSRPALGL